MENGQLLIVASSHLYWDPKYDYVKYGWTNYLLWRVGKFRQKVIQENVRADPAIILCGDFNSFPHSSSVSLIYNTQDYAKNKFYRVTP